jgi:hypothetical protein
MSSIENYVNCNLKPTEVTDYHWLHEYQEKIAEKYPLTDGKWMQFYDLPRLDIMWEFAKTRYRAGRLEGIHSMKVSTSCYNPRASTSSQGVIIFFCGPSLNETIIMQFGQKLLEEIPYKTFTGWMHYKSNEQTGAGTAATGQKKNYLYRIQCARN